MEEVGLTVTFEAIGAGASDLLFDFETTFSPDTVKLRDSNNDPIPKFVEQETVIAVKSPLPDASFMGVYAADSMETAFPAENGTKARLRVNDSGDNGKVTTTLYEEKPPGGDGATFNDPDGEVANPAVSNRYWELTSSLSGDFDVDARFSYAGLGGIEAPSKLRVARRGLAAQASDDWTLVPVAQTSVYPASEEVQITNTSSMEYGSGQYALVSDESENALPVELTRFAARADGRSAVLTWRTASETNNARFVVQRLVKGTTSVSDSRSSAWKVIGGRDGAGTTSEVQRYRFTDGNLPFTAKALTYRLKQVDLDGTASYSGEIKVEVGAPDAFTLYGNFPNPVRRAAVIRYALPEPAPVTLAVYDALGRRVATLADARKRAGRHTATFEAGDLPSGVYVYRLRAGAHVEARRMVVAR